MIGKVLDSSALAALVRGRVSAAAWLATMRTLSLPLYLPSLALIEVRAVRPDAGPVLAEFVGHPSVVLGELDASSAARSIGCSRTPMSSTLWPGRWCMSLANAAGQP